MNYFFKTCLAFILTISVFSVNAQQSDSTDVKVSVEKFLQSFNSLQWEPFRKSFADDATIFFPEWEQASRRIGRAEIEKTWLDLFPEFKDPNNILKLGITPRDVRIQVYDQTAIVTFHLGNGEKYLSRRTLVMVKQKEEWKIAHLHASTLFPPENK
ncbi:MAG TPA: nuclear transport factor 2 family protein [Chryseolinea sp.]|nr:nuclear transport factor 2 family protein [Chryseolinea sp.]HPH45623.1 nuclear transport factor 2 family protein [Chryseolinea sp.]HPM29694.1 nuclear transport factor 2 family protein [Chryseolinea sp.]